jgi:hypothetical protein
MLQVTIPHYPGDQSQFQTPRASLSAEEARVLAAEVTQTLLITAGQSMFFTKGTIAHSLHGYK